MLSFRRLAVTTAAVATLAVPAAAQARPDIQPVSQQPTIDKVSPDARYGVPAKTASTIDKVSPDARYGVPDATTPRFITVPSTEVVEADNGFAWGDALIGGGAALGLTLLIGGTALIVRPRHSGLAH
jgi:hypothetical protein